MFSLVLAPMIFFGCAYYPWSALAAFPFLQKAVPVNPLVYASGGFRGALAPQFPHLPKALAVGALPAFDALFAVAGIKRFQKEAIN
jgi:ABC-2 type transport system permease protein